MARLVCDGTQARGHKGDTGRGTSRLVIVAIWITVIHWCGRPPQQFFERALVYAEQVQQVDSQFLAAVTQAGEDLHNQYNVICKQLAANLGQTAPFGSDAAYTAMQPAIGGMIQEAVKHAAGARKHENDALHERVVGRSRRLVGSRQDAGFLHFGPSKYSLLCNGIERIVK